MSFVMIATGAPSSARVRTLSMRALAVGVVACALVLLAGGAALGYSLGHWAAGPAVAPHEGAAATGAERPRAALPFTLEQLGKISARVYELESQAAHLAQRVHALQPGAKDAPAASPSRPAQGAAPGSPAASAGVDVGGPLLPPQPVSLAAFDDLQARLDQLEQRFALVADAAAERNLALLRMPTRLPVHGDIDLSSPFGNREDPFTHHLAFHPGLDFAAPWGSKVFAAAGGVVTYAGPRSGYGNMVEIDHGNGLATRYGHASKLLVKPGMIVAPGDAVALVGSTGRSTGPHLHFEVLRHGEPVNPARYLAGL
jgi:murein DD-endopeptidase MepM/ murein hydrolase activator NlpD